MKLFILGSNGIELNTPEILLVQEFKVLLDRDRTLGKVRAWEEFKFIYYIVDPRSYPNQQGYDEKAAIKFASKECNFPDDYKPDDAIVKAVARYAELRSSIAAEVCEELLIAFRNSVPLMRKMRGRMEELLLLPILTVEQVREIINLQKEITGIANGVPEMIEKITKAQTELEETDVKLGRGKKVISNSQRPESAIG